MKKKLNIGFDIGTTSVGWSLIDEDYNIVDMGVRLFNDPANPKDGKLKNDKRRSSRTNRRRIRRIRTRKDAFANFLVNKKWINSTDELADLINIDITEFGVDNPIQLKVKGLSSKLTKEELIYVLFHYIHHRGFFYVTQEMLKNDISIEKEEKYPSVEMEKFYKANGYYKGAEENQTYSARDYINEIKKLLTVQGVDKEFTEEYIAIFSQVRDFATGPGSQKSPTPYGLWYLNKEGKLECKGNNLWDATIGKCTYFPEENRGLKNSPVAEMFNLMNDISNIYSFSDKNRHLTEDAKLWLFKAINKELVEKLKKKNVTVKEIVKAISSTSKDEIDQNIKDTDLGGYRIDKNSKPEFTSLSNYSVIVKWMLQNNLMDKKIDLFNLDTLNKANELFVLVASKQDAIKQMELLEEKYPNTSNESNLQLLKTLEGMTKSHSLSYKAMNMYLEYVFKNLDNTENQMQFFTKNITSSNSNVKPSKYLKTGLYDDEIISPTARRAFNQNIKVMNKIIKFYSDKYDIENITFELARDKNSAEERKSITKMQADNQKEVETICKENDINQSRLNSASRLRLKLWIDQGKFDIYDGEPITLEEVLTGKGLQIDHIIPYSICAIDSRSNKVLTKSYNNKEKLDSTPYQWLTKKGKFEEFKDRVEKYIQNPRKREFLLYMLDPLRNMEGFIERNIVDTRYASRVVLNTFQDFFRTNKELYPNVKIKVINGSITNFARYNLLTNSDNTVLLHKDRDLYCHHAIDASIVCYLGMNHTLSNLAKWFNNTSRTSDSLTKTEDNRLMNKDTGEIIDISGWVKESKEMKDFAMKLSEYNDEYDSNEKKIISNNKVKFSRQIVKKNNVQLSNETIYSFKWKNENEGNIVNKIDLLDCELKKLDMYFKDGMAKEEELDNLYVYKWDRQMYDKLKVIYNQYWDGKSNPFVQYMNSEHNIEKPNIIRIEKQFVRKLKVLGNPKTTDNIIVLNKHNKKAIQESLNSIGVRIYKDKNNKYVLIPINLKVLTYNGKRRSLVIDNKLLNELLAKTNIENDSYIEVTAGTIFVNKVTGKLYYSNGGGNFKEGRLEIKALFASNEKAGFNSDRAVVILNTIIREYDIAEVDELGNIYNRREIKL